MTQWALGLQWLGLLAITHMPYFGCAIKVNTRVKHFMSCFHEDYLWLDTKVTIAIDLISHITILHKEGVDPSLYFNEKNNKKWLVARIKNIYDVVHEKRSYVISTINDKEFCVAMKLLVVKILHKNRQN